MHVRVATWNVQWAKPTSRKTPEIHRRLEEFAPDVVCATEADSKLLSQDGHTICSQTDYGYRQTAGRRKVVLWSRETWKQVDDVGKDSLPPGTVRVRGYTAAAGRNLSCRNLYSMVWVPS